MWQRFTERARKVVLSAAEEAHKFGGKYVSTEHLLLGLIREPGSVACRVLEMLDVSLELIRAEVEKQIPQGDAPPDQEMSLTPRAKRVIDLAYDEARNLSNNYIGTEHLLLGLLREGDGLAGKVFSKLGVELEKARREVMALQDNETQAKAQPVTDSAADIDDDDIGTDSAASQPPIGQRFTERARRAVFYALEDAQKFGEVYVSSEHLLLGLIRGSDSTACRSLEKLGVSLNRIRAEVEKQLPRGDARPNQDVTLTPRAKRVIDLAYEEARNLNNNYIGTEHLLLGLIREGDGLAGRVLSKLGVDLEKTRREVMAFQDSQPQSTSESAPELAKKAIVGSVFAIARTPSELVDAVRAWFDIATHFEPSERAQVYICATADEPDLVLAKAEAYRLLRSIPNIEIVETGEGWPFTAHRSTDQFILLFSSQLGSGRIIEEYDNALTGGTNRLVVLNRGVQNLSAEAMAFRERLIIENSAREFDSPEELPTLIFDAMNAPEATSRGFAVLVCPPMYGEMNARRLGEIKELASLLKRYGYEVELLTIGATADTIEDAWRRTEDKSQKRPSVFAYSGEASIAIAQDSVETYLRTWESGTHALGIPLSMFANDREVSNRTSLVCLELTFSSEEYSATSFVGPALISHRSVRKTDGPSAVTWLSTAIRGAKGIAESRTLSLYGLLEAAQREMAAELIVESHVNPTANTQLLDYSDILARYQFPPESRVVVVGSCHIIDLLKSQGVSVIESPVQAPLPSGVGRFEFAKALEGASSPGESEAVTLICGNALEIQIRAEVYSKAVGEPISPLMPTFGYCSQNDLPAYLPFSVTNDIEVLMAWLNDAFLDKSRRLRRASNSWKDARVLCAGPGAREIEASAPVEALFEDKNELGEMRPYIGQYDAVIVPEKMNDAYESTWSPLLSQFPSLIRYEAADEKLGSSEIQRILDKLSSLIERKFYRKKVGISGTGAYELPDSASRVALALGRALADNGYELVIGLWPGVDNLVAASFIRRCREIGTMTSGRLIIVVDITEEGMTPIAEQPDPKLWSDPEFRGEGEVIFANGAVNAAQRIDAVVLIGGVGGGYLDAKVAMNQGKLVIPIAGTGGRAARIYKECAPPHPAANLTRAEQSRLADAWKGLTHPATTERDAIRIVEAAMNVIALAADDPDHLSKWMDPGDDGWLAQ